MNEYVASCQEEAIYDFGIGKTPTMALGEFLSSGEFNEYCRNNDVAHGEEVEINVWKIYRRDEMDYDELSLATDEGWQWVTRGKPVLTKTVVYKESK